MNKRIGLLKVMTFKDTEEDLHKRVIEESYPDVDVVSKCIEDQYDGIYDEATEQKAIPKILKLGAEMADERIHALIIDCAADPGVRELRQAVRIPVIGAGSAAASLARGFGERIATIGIRESAPEIFAEVLGGHLVYQNRPSGVKNAKDLMTETGRKNSFDLIDEILKCSVDVICLACTGFARLNIAPDLEKAACIPVIDALDAAALYAWYAVKKYQ